MNEEGENRRVALPRTYRVFENQRKVANSRRGRARTRVKSVNRSDDGGNSPNERANRATSLLAGLQIDCFA